MTNIKFTATVIWKGKGCCIARADELSITTPPATTQRGAKRNLKDAVLPRFREAAQEGTLQTVLDDAGYAGMLIGSGDITLECHILETDTITLPLPRQLSALDRAARKRRRQPATKGTTHDPG
jgi:hypothetical protein